MQRHHIRIYAGCNSKHLCLRVDLNRPYYIAIQGVILPVPEPSALGLLGIGAIALLVRRRRNSLRCHVTYVRTVQYEGSGFPDNVWACAAGIWPPVFISCGQPGKNVAGRPVLSYLRDMAIINRVLKVKFMFWTMFTALSVAAQTSQASATNATEVTPSSPTQSVQSPTNQTPSLAEHIQQIRADCIQNRRYICGKILQVLPEGLVIDSGYTDLLRVPSTGSWLVPGTVTASRATGLIEGQEPDSICVGLVFLTDIPKSRRPKPKLYDYVIYRLSHRPIYLHLRGKRSKNHSQIYRGGGKGSGSEVGDRNQIARPGRRS